MTEFYVGQKVVCIANGTWEKARREFPHVSVPIRGEIYTIRELYRDPFHGGVGIRLAEIRNPDYMTYYDHTYYIEIGWVPDEFRPLTDTDISVFKKLLVPVE